MPNEDSEVGLEEREGPNPTALSAFRRSRRNLFCHAGCMMAKHPKRRMGRYLKGRVDEEVPLGTLVTKTAVVASFDEVVDDATLVSSIVGKWAIEGLTAGEGPIEVGVAHGDYTLAEIEEYLENTGSWNESDKVQSREVARRLVRSVGILSSDEDMINDGKPVKTKLNWLLNEGQTLDLWAYNISTGQLTTGAIVHLTGHANLWPK